MFCAAHASADAPAGFARSQGFGVDGQLVGGVGVGLGHAIDNNFLGRARLGALYAYEPWIVNAGLTAELGALASFGLGAELELNTLAGWFAQAGLGRISGGELMTHAAFGYSVVGIEWQHSFGHAASTDALLLDVRLPLGLFWFFKKHDDDDKRGASSAGAPRSPPQMSSDAGPTPVLPPDPSADDRFLAQKNLEQARVATERGDHARASQALRQAYALEADPLLLLLLADAEVARGKLVLAAQELERFLRDAQTPEAMARRAEAANKLAATRARLGRLRVLHPDGLTGAVAEIDGEPAVGALLGYDVAVDPGAHTLRVRRGDAQLFERTFTAVAGELVRVELVASEAPASPPPSAASEPAPVAK